MAWVSNESIELSKWLINAFNGEWLKTEDPAPIPKRDIG
jgi:hypothetical protein